MNKLPWLAVNHFSEHPWALMPGAWGRWGRQAALQRPLQSFPVLPIIVEDKC